MGRVAPHRQKRDRHAARESDWPSRSAITAVLTAKKSEGEHQKVPPCVIEVGKPRSGSCLDSLRSRFSRARAPLAVTIARIVWRAAGEEPPKRDRWPRLGTKLPATVSARRRWTPRAVSIAAGVGDVPLLSSEVVIP